MTTNTTNTVKGNTMRLLIHPHNDRALLENVKRILDDAVTRDPDHWDHVTDRPAIVDHYGYHDDMRSCVVLSEEYKSAYYRLTIRDIDDATHDALRATALSHYARP